MMVILKMLQSVTLPLGSWSYRWTYGYDWDKVDLSPITSTSSMTDILMDGRKEELLIGRNEKRRKSWT
jgi:hypothetical protein